MPKIKTSSLRSVASTSLALTATATFSIFACVVLLELSWLSAVVAVPLALVYGVAYGKLLYNQFRAHTASQGPGELAFLFIPKPCDSPNCEDHRENKPTPSEDDAAASSMTLEEKLHRVAWHASAAFSLFYMACVFMVVSPWPIWATMIAISVPCILGIWYYRNANQHAFVSKSRISSSTNQQSFFDRLDQHSSLCWLLLHALFESIVPIAGVRVLFMQHKQYFSAFIGVSLVGLASGILKTSGELSVIYPWLHAHDTKPSRQKGFSTFKMLAALALCLLSALGLGYELYAHALHCFVSLSMAPLAATLTAAILSVITASLWTWLLFSSTQSGVCSHQSSQQKSGFQATLWKAINLTAALINGVIATIELSEIIPAMGVLGYLPGVGAMITAGIIAFTAAILLDGVFLNGSINNDPTIGVFRRFILSFTSTTKGQPRRGSNLKRSPVPKSAPSEHTNTKIVLSNADDDEPICEDCEREDESESTLIRKSC